MPRMRPLIVESTRRSMDPNIQARRGGAETGELVDDGLKRQSPNKHAGGDRPKKTGWK
jgi:hypothetical protein